MSERLIEKPEARAIIAEKVLSIVDDFIVDQRITCEETVYQTNRVIANAYELIAALCAVAGYAERLDDD